MRDNAMKKYIPIPLIAFVIILSGCVSSYSSTGNTDYYTDDIQALSFNSIGPGSYNFSDNVSDEDMSYAIAAFGYLTGDTGKRVDFLGNQFYLAELSYPIKVIDPWENAENVFMLSNVANPSDKVFLVFYASVGDGTLRTVIPTSLGGPVLFSQGVLNSIIVLDQDGNSISGSNVMNYRKVAPPINEEYVYPLEISTIATTNESNGIVNVFEAALEYVEKKLGFNRTRILYVDENLSIYPDYFAILDDGRFYRIAGRDIMSGEANPKPVPGTGFTTIGLKGHGDLPAIIDSKGVASFAFQTGNATYSEMEKDVNHNTQISDEMLASWDEKLAKAGFFVGPSGIAVSYSDANHATILTDMFTVAYGADNDDISAVVISPDFGNPTIYIGFSFIDAEYIPELDEILRNSVSGGRLKREDLDKLVSIKITDMYGKEAVFESSEIARITDGNDGFNDTYTCWFRLDNRELYDFDTVLRHASEYFEAPNVTIDFEFADSTMNKTKTGVSGLYRAEQVLDAYYEFDEIYHSGTD